MSPFFYVSDCKVGLAKSAKEHNKQTKAKEKQQNNSKKLVENLHNSRKMRTFALTNQITIKMYGWKENKHP